MQHETKIIVNKKYKLVDNLYSYLHKYCTEYDKLKLISIIVSS